MSERFTSIALAAVLGWIAWGAVALFISGPVGLIAGAVIGAAAAVYLRDTMVLRGLVAVLDPLGIVVPVLILRQAAISIGVPIQPFAALEIMGFLALYIAFLAAALGALPADPYRFGYSPVPVAALVLALCLYGALSGHWIIPVIAVAGQALWAGKIGSSNYFDHITHVALVPVCVVVLIVRMVT